MIHRRMQPRDSGGPLRLLFTSAYNAISFYSTISLPLFLSVIVCVRIMSTNGVTQRKEKKLLAFSNVSSFYRYSSVYPWRILPWLRFSLTPRCREFSITEPVTSLICVTKRENTLKQRLFQCCSHKLYIMTF